MTNEIIVVKIGGSTLGSHDTTLADVAELHRRGEGVIIVHGGGPIISDWLARMNVSTRFERGLRVTDEASLEVVVAVLSGLVNKQLVAQLSGMGATAVGLSGCDGGMLKAEVKNPDLGFVGEIADVDVAPLVRVILAGGLPVIAPIGIGWQDGASTGQLLNINADTVAGAIASALGRSRLILMTDVEGVMVAGAVISSMTADEAHALTESGVIAGGMIPKVEACLMAVANGASATIIDGREEHALLSLMDGVPTGTIVG